MMSTWVDTLTKLTNPEGAKLFPSLFYECSGCNGTGETKLAFSMEPHTPMKCVQFLCDGGVKRIPNGQMMGALVRIYQQVIIGQPLILNFKGREPEEIIAEDICMRAALTNYTGKVGNTT